MLVYNIFEAELEKVEYSGSYIQFIVFQFFKICFPIFQDSFQLFKWVDMILRQGPVTGPVDTLARALTSGGSEY